MSDEWDEQYDVVVVGSGGGGLTAAWTAARAGLEVLVLEAAPLFGGTTAYSGGGMWFPANRVLREAGLGATAQEARDYFRAVVGDRTPRALQDAFLAGGPALVDELLTDDAIELQPFPWPDYYGAVPGAQAVSQVLMAPLDPAELGELADAVRPPLKADRAGLPRPTPYGGGQALIARLLLSLSRKDNVTLRRGTPCLDLAATAGGSVTGVVTDAGRIHARRGVILAAGGFEQNAGMRREYGVPGSVTGAMGPATNTGLPTSAAIRLGAATDLMDQAWWAPGIAHPDGTTSFSLWFTGGIFVGAAGQRFVNESLPYDRIGRAVIAGQRSGAVGDTFWMVYDDREGQAPPVRSTTLPLGPAEDCIAAGLWHSADSLAELADLIGVPADALEATVDRFNEHASAGHDPDFARGEEMYDRAFSGDASPLVPIEKGPFHAVAFGLSDLGTKGGLVTDADARVLDTAGIPIPGLYAAGNTMAAVSGETYPAGGNPIAASMVFGHLAANHLSQSSS